MLYLCCTQPWITNFLSFTLTDANPFLSHQKHDYFLEKLHCFPLRQALQIPTFITLKIFRYLVYKLRLLPASKVIVLLCGHIRVFTSTCASMIIFLVYLFHYYSKYFFFVLIMPESFFTIIITVQLHLIRLNNEFFVSCQLKIVN